MEISRKRILFIFGVVLVSFVFFMFTAIKLEIFPDARIVERAKTQYTIEDKLIPRRGNIMDRGGLPLAVSVDLDSVFADPSLVIDTERPKIAQELSSILSLDYKDVFEKLGEPKRFVRIKSLLSFDESAKLQQLLFKKNKKGKSERLYPGIGIIKEPKRIYPNDTLASHVIGFVNRDADGKDGVEKYYDEFIKSRASSIKYSRDGEGRVIYSGADSFLTSDNGNTVYLTIDNNIQYQVERELKKTVDQKQALSGTVIVMNPKNGEILALANYPSYNPNDLSTTDNFAMKNRSVTDGFEPGSVFKIVTAGIALKNKAISLTDKLWGENGHFQLVGGKHPVIIKEAKGHDYGYMDIKTLIAKSSNIGSAKLGLMIGKNNFYKGIDDFGFGRKTEVDLPGEVNGILIRNNVGKVELANMGFGQGISVTPMQVVKAYSAVANGGYIVIPHVLKKIVNEDNEVIYEYPYERGSQIISNDLSKELRSMLRGVVEEGGTATATDITGFEIAGKTGTAQKAIGGHYSKDKYVVSFGGLFPASDPQYVMLVLIDEPKGAYFASVVAVPLFKTIAYILIQGSEKLVPIYTKKQEVPQQKIEEKEENIEDYNLDSQTVPNLSGKTVRTALKMIPPSFKKVNVYGDGRVVKQDPQAGPKSEEAQAISIWLE